MTPGGSPDHYDVLVIGSGFGGAGPSRTGCEHCGGCMVGCRFGAKNTLDRNYLYLAEQAGAQVHPERQVVDVGGTATISARGR